MDLARRYGLEVTRQCHSGAAHVGTSLVDCYRCGQEVAVILRRFGVGATGPTNRLTLSYRDVLILTESDRLRDRAEDPTGRLQFRASDFVQGLRNEGLPVCVRQDHDIIPEEMPDIDLAIPDQITVAHPLAVSGLEPKVVVWLRRPAEDRYMLYAMEHLFAESRCTTHLVVVDAPIRRTEQSSCNNVGCVVFTIVLAIYLFWFIFYPRFFFCMIGNFNYCEF
ncbi:hypothetical protein V1264_007102 [Littorina saxatilis]|uniref:Uncharacterized protein n=1 Tax=Littorina saxatilis TaxID=31220 RepID=A0AAN9AUH3_9CAEN